MTVRATDRPLTRLEAAQAQAGHVLGARRAKRIAMFGNGTLYVKAGTMTQVMSWLIDFVVCLFAVAVGVVALSVVDRAVTLSGGALAGAALSLFVLVPVLFVVLMVSAFSTGSSGTPGSLVRTSIDPDATRRLNAAGIR